MNNNYSNDEYTRKLLGLSSLDKNNMPSNVPVGKYYDPSSAGALQNIQKNPQYRKNYGDFSGGVGWDKEAKKATGCDYVLWLKAGQSESDTGEEYLPPEEEV